jgi:Myb-like DNA-binding domain
MTHPHFNAPNIREFVVDSSLNRGNSFQHGTMPHRPFRIPRRRRTDQLSECMKATHCKGSWSQEERQTFLLGLRMFGYGAWKEIGAMLPTRYESESKSMCSIESMTLKFLCICFALPVDFYARKIEQPN